MNENDCHFTWLEHREKLVALVQGLYDDETFFDCTLYAGGHHFDVHRLILSSCSPFFHEILQQHNSDNPVITLDGVTSIELRALIEYMYTGETSVPPEFLDRFFQTTKLLQIAGLSHYNIEVVDKLLNEEGGSETNDEDLKYNYDPDNQNILSYLESSGESQDIHTRPELPSSDVTEERVTLPEKDFSNESGPERNDVDRISVPPKLPKTAVKVETSDELRSESLTVNSNAPGATEIDDSTDEELSEGYIYEKYHDVLLTEDEAMTESFIADENSTRICETDEREEAEYWELNQDDQIQDEGENYIYVKLDKNTLQRVKSNQVTKIKSERNDDDHGSAEKYMKVINNMSRNFLKVKRPKIQTLIGQEIQSSPDDKKIYICLKCGNKYSHRRTLLHHIHWICDQPATYSCKLCPYMGKRKFQLKSHMKHAHLQRMS